MSSIKKLLDFHEFDAVEPEYVKLIEECKKELEQLLKIKDHCTTCGCNEFLCGHNKRD